MTPFRLILVSIWILFGSIAGLFLLPLRLFGVDVNWPVVRILSSVTLKLLRIDIELQNAELLTKETPCIFVANHRSALDIFTMGSIVPPNTIAIGKRELIFIPFFGLLFWGLGNILINRQKRKEALNSLEKAEFTVKKTGKSIWLFPEGTRNRTDQPLLPFKKGAFYLAASTGVSIVPVVASDVSKIRQIRMWKSSKATVVIKVLPAISINNHSPNDLKIKVAEQMKEALLGLGNSPIKRTVRP